MKNTFTIILPTVNREKEFKSTLNTLLAEKYSALEIIIAANGVEWDIQGYISNLDDDRIVLRRHIKQVSMAENWSDAIDNARGEFLFVIGDDDGWYPGSMPLIDNLLDSNQDINVLTWRRDDFGWPDAVPCIRDRLYINYNKKFHIIESKNLLNKIYLDELSHEYLPKIYSSFIRKALLNRFKEFYGSYFVDPSNPDITTGIQVLAHETRIIRSELPFSVIGTSRTSNGATSALSGCGSTQNDISPEEEFQSIWPIGVGPELAILNCLARSKRAMSLSSMKLRSSTRLIRYVLDLPPSSRESALKLLLSESRFWQFTATELERLAEIKFRNYQLPQPVNIIGTTENSINRGVGSTFNAIIYTPSVGIDSIERAVCFSLILRTMLN